MDDPLHRHMDDCSLMTDRNLLLERAIRITDYRDTNYVSDEALVEFLRSDIHGGERKYVDRLYPVLLRRCSRRINKYLVPYPNASRDAIETEVLGKVTDLLMEEDVPSFPLAKFGLWFKRRFIDARRSAESKFKAELEAQIECNALDEDRAELPDDSLDSAVFLEQIADQLSEQEWELLMMYFHHGLKRKEITKMLGCASKTTYNRIEKLKQKLNKISQGDDNAD